MTSYKTPGVYIEEIVKFPPSVAQVETAIPAFIGYTETAIRKVTGDLHERPTRITSMLEYENHFGLAKAETDITVNVIDGVVAATPPSAANKSPFLMYYSLQLYFANGGGPCYITSVGQYGEGEVNKVSSVTKGPLDNGLAEIRKVDEPTLLVFPDATSLADYDDFYAVYGDALTQCNELQDRFTIIDTYSDVPFANKVPADPDILPDAGLRNGISLGKDYLKYGAAYYPFLETILDYRYDETAIDVTISTTAPRNLQAEVINISAKTKTNNLGNLITELKTLADDVNAIPAGPSQDTDAVAMIPSFISKINEVKAEIDKVKGQLNDALTIASEEPTAATQANALDTWITNVLEQLNLDLNKTIDRLNADTTKATLIKEVDYLTASATNNPSLQRVLGTHDDNVAADAITDKVDKLDDTGAGELRDLISALPTSSGSAVVKKLNVLKDEDDQTYNRIKAEINSMPIKLPPSSAMAGIYARVDTDRGVWKAPANVGVTYTVKPSVQVSHDDQKDLNVDTVAGKSINAIRSFTGKGVLVWGARTLAGNDNEWRYVPVRRFFNMVEESVKKATEQFVFEPNDANTWVRIKAMINNFLTLQWRAGALAGPTPESAFYVNIGLGETMTAQDILEGNMIVEIGMAAVRPAEFIVLKFSHKMQEA